MLMSLAVEAGLQGKAVIVAAPTFDQTRVVLGETLHALGAVGERNLSRLEVSLPNSGRIIFRSLDDADNVRGHTADLVLVDEAAYCQPEAWFEVLRPMLIDTGGDAWLAGTPNGHNWFWQEWVRAQAEPNSMAWQAPTLGYEVSNGRLIRCPHPLENPFISEAEIEQLFGTMLEVQFKQEILAIPGESEGQVFRNVLGSLYPASTSTEGCKGHRLTLGLDWGQRNDFTAYSIGCADCRKELALDRFQGDYPLQQARLKAVYEAWRPEMLAESNSIGLPNTQALQAAGVPVMGFDTTHASKMQVIQGMRLAFEQQSWKWLDIPWATQELEAYEMSVTKQGNVTYSAPTGMHDDSVIGRALMLWQAQLGGFSLA